MTSTTGPRTLAGKRALVTGASSGLGAHFAEVLAAHGAELVIAARRMSSLEDVARRVEALGAVRCLALDVTDAASRQDLVTAAGPIDILVNNAGVVRESPALNHGEDDWDAVMGTNLKGMFFLAQAVAPRMRERAAGASSTWPRSTGCARRRAWCRTPSPRPASFN